MKKEVNKLGYLNEFTLMPLTIYMYHGSDRELDILKPTAFNAGHKFKKPSWSVFLWNQYNLAYKWAAFKCLMYFIKLIPDRKSTIFGKHINIGFNDYDQELYVWNQEYEKFLRAVIEGKPKFYVYTIEVPINSKFNFGNNNSQPEFAYDGELKIHKKDTYILTEKIYRECFKPVSDEKYEQLMKNGLTDNVRGVLGYIFEPTNEVMGKWKYVTRKVKHGEIQPGDDLDIIMADYEKDMKERKI